MAECKPIMKNGVCIAGRLRRCAGCEVEFIKDLRKAQFQGVIFHRTGKKERL